uniref:Pentacotripeptide-repeat region of PRORP domain-containing protein n=1 Tax=Lygus hesperus TaxID=30085 RepID=A0A146KXA8_LYGHE
MQSLCRAPRLPSQLATALALYRRLRDGENTLTVDSYAALMGCSVGAPESSNAHFIIEAKKLTVALLVAEENTIMMNTKSSNSEFGLALATAAATAVNKSGFATDVVDYRDPLRAFAFYHEAQTCCRVTDFTPELYTNLIKAYVHAGYGVDARKTLEVLIDAGAPLSVSTFHTLLSSSALTLRDAEEVLGFMTTHYHLTPSPFTYAWLMLAAVRQRHDKRSHPRLHNSQLILQLFDFHEAAVQSIVALHEDRNTNRSAKALTIQ